jgi:NtrC-family two-component system sensor histidine kinase KinB
MAPRWSRHLWWILGLASLISLGSWILHSTVQLDEWITLLLSIGLIAFLFHFKFPLGGIQINLTHAITLILGIALNPGSAGIALTIGFLIREILHILYQRLFLKKSSVDGLDLEVQSLEYSRHALSLFGGLTLYQILGGTSIRLSQSLPDYLPSIGLACGFTALFLALHWLTRVLLESRRPTRKENITLILVAFLPIPFALLSAVAYANMGVLALGVFGSIYVIIAPILRNLSQAERNLQRRLEELSTIGHISQTMRTTLNMENLLTTIYLQVAHLLQVDNFYVALISPEEDTLSYPIAVKNGRREEWPSRPLADRLTENVIITSTPILIREGAPEILREMGFPELDNPPFAWLGVPLLTPERTIGCIGVFHTDDGKKLTEKDQEILVTLAGQASVAIDNALLYDQTRRRARALALLNEITTSISSTLDPDRALELVGQSMIRVGGGQKSAIHLLDAENQNMFLASAVNLSEAFIKASRSIPLDNHARAAAIINNQTTLVHDLRKSPYPLSVKKLFQDESIRSIAEIPLVSPQGIIGQLAVYFTEPQPFNKEDVELLETFAAQAAIAVSNTRMHAETDLALQKRIEQLSTIEAIGREMVTTLDLDELFTIILDHALRLTDSEIGHLVVYEQDLDGLRVAAQRGCLGNSKAAQVGQISPIDDSAVGRAFKSATAQTVQDMFEDPTSANWSGAGTQSMLSVPITRKGQSMGVITLENTSPAAFQVEQELALTQLASQAAIALSNAWLYQELEDHLREQALLFQAGKEIATTLETKAVAHAVVDNMSIALSVKGVNLYRYNDQQEMLSLLVSVEEGHPKKLSKRSHLQIEDAPALFSCISQGLPIQWTQQNAPSIPDLQYLTDQREMGAILAIPLIVGEEIFGLVEVLSKSERIFKERELRTARTIAGQAAIALKNTDLFRQIQDNHESLLAVLNSTEEGILMADPDGEIVLSNHQLENLIGISPDDLIHRNLADPDLDIADRLGFSQHMLSERLASISEDLPAFGTTVSYEIQKPKYRALERTETSVIDSTGNQIGWLMVIRDISNELEIKETRNRLTEMIVHDLRSPLTAILSSLKILGGLSSEEAENPMVKQALSVAQRSCDQMLGLVNSLLDIAKLETGQLPLSEDSITFQNLCADLIETYIPAANELGILLNYEMDSELPVYLGDKEKIGRVLLNLIDNALRFTPPGGQVLLNTKYVDDSIVISVSDTGPGIPSEYREKIFDRFVQVPGSTGRGLGTGLGLSFAKLTIEAHHGEIWVEDNPEGGSVFVIRLPLDQKKDGEPSDA